MSSPYVRTQFKNFISANIGAEKLLDLSGEYREIKELLSDNSIVSGEVWAAVEFTAGDDLPITVGSSNTSGKYRETGLVTVHIVGIAKLGGPASTLARAQALIEKVRGLALGTIIIDSVSPPDFNISASLNFSQGFVAAGFFVTYKNDVDL